MKNSKDAAMFGAALIVFMVAGLAQYEGDIDVRLTWLGFKHKCREIKEKFLG